MGMLDQLKLSLETMLDSTATLLVGVSGGVDSLSLLDGLNRLGCDLIVAHLDHSLRPESGSDAQFVAGEADSRGIPCVIEKLSVRDYAHEHNLSLEEAAREVRYRFLFDQAKEHGAQGVVIAHNADDQVETVLMHLLRGSGLDGLTGMVPYALPNPWSDTIPLVRPLLNVWRDEIEVYCQEHNLNPIFDSSNLDTTFFRNRLRHELIPELETYVPGFSQRLWQTSDLLSADRELLNDLVVQIWEQITLEIGQEFVTFSLSTFILQPLSLQRRLIRKAVAHLQPGARDIDFALVQRVLDFAAQPTSTGQADIGLNLRVSIEGQVLMISNWDADLISDHWPQITKSQPVSIPGEVDFGNGWVLRAEYVSPDLALVQMNEDPYRAWIDLGNRELPLNIQQRQPGNRIQPLGMGGKSIKLSDLMINVKIPQRARDNWPILWVGDEIAWLPGYRLSELFQISPESRRIICVEVSRI